jgi:PAS domain S-box-containing protein
VLNTRQPAVVQDVRLTPGIYRAIVDPADIKSFIHVPIQLDDTALGILNCSWVEVGAVPPDAVERLSGLADQAAIAIRNAQLYTEIRTARDRLDVVWRHAGQPLLVLDAAGHVTAANPAAEALFGFPAESGAEGPVSALPAAEWPRLWHLLQEAVAGEPAQVELDVPLHDPGETVIPALITLAPLRYVSGKITAAVAVVTDLRAQKRQEAERLQLERLHALGQLAAGVAHDFNNALAHIVTRAEVLRLDYGQDAPALSQGLEAVVRSAMDAGATVRRILDFARERPERPLTPVNLDAVVHDVEMLTGPLWRAMAQARSIPIQMAVETGRSAAMMGDPVELREALINLIHNAVAAMPEGGTVTVTTGQQAGRTFLAVQDTGVGMDAATQARIFEPFFTTKGEQGSGLGLSMVYGTMRRHGGEVTVDSALGRGTVFTLWFPTLGSPAGSAAAGPAAAAVPPLRILVVDDEPALAIMVERMLRLDGHTVVTCSSGAQALQAAGEHPFDLVVSDVSMPGMSGWELARALRQQQPDVPVAFITGWGQHLESAEMAAAGVQCVLAKPFQRENLRALVAEATGRSGPGGSGAGPSS